MIKTYKKHQSLEPNSQSNTTDAVGFGLIWQAVLKRKIMLVSIMFLIITLPILYLVIKYRSPVEAAWFDDSFAYRTGYTIGNTGSAVTNRKVKIDVDTATLITAGKLQSDCDDVRFTDNNGKLLDYFIDTNEAACNTSSTDFYAKMDVIAGNQVVYMYYGNPQATNTRKNDFFADGTLGVGLKGYWKLDEASGTRSDYAHTNDLTDNNTVTQATGKVSSAAQFTAANDEYLSKTDNADLSTGNIDFTLAAWVYADSLTDTKAVVGKGTDWIANEEYVIYYAGTGVDRFRFVIGDGSSGTTLNADNLGSPSTGTWYFIVGWHDASANTINIQVNNGSVNSTAWTTGSHDSAGAFGIGTLAGFGSTQDWNGRIDNVKFYKKVLTAGERASLYNSGSGLEISSPLTFTPTSGPTAASEEKSAGPVAYWKFDEGYGTSTNDSTSNANTGTLGAGTASYRPTWQSEDQCISGKCLYFDGTDDYITSANSITIGTSDFTVQAWVKSQDTSAKAIVGTVSGGGQTGFLLYTNYSGSTPYFATWGGANPSISAITQTNNDGKWHHIVGVRSGTTLAIYIDGKLDNSTTATVVDLGSSSIAPRIGAMRVNPPTDTQHPFKGFIDDVKIYPYARTAAQVKTDFAKASSVKGTAVSLGSSAKNNDALSNGLVGYWKMDETAANSCTGGVNDSCDSSGNANDGAWNGDATSVTGKFGNGVTLDGTGDYINVVDSTSLDSATSQVTLSAWIYPTATTGYHTIIGKKYSTQWWLGLYNGTYRLQIWLKIDGTARQLISSNTLVTVNQWNHIVGTYDGSKVTLYVNGSLDTSWSYTGILSTDPASNLYIGADREGATDPTYYFAGKIDDVRIYNRALSPKEVRDLYNWAPGPMAYWDLNEKTGSTVYDRSGNGYTGTLSGATLDLGKFGGGAKFSVNTDNIDTANISPSQFTYTAWFKRTGTDSAERYVVGHAANGRNIEIYTNKLCYYFSGHQCGSTTFTANTWYHAAAVYNGTNLSIYLNGVLERSDVRSVGNGSGNFQIGSWDSSGTWAIDGYVDDVRIYNYARTSKQIVEDMNAGHPAVGSPVGSAIGYWKFDEGNGITANNSGNGGSALNGTLTSMASPATATSGWTNSGKFGKALAFDGTDDQVNLGNPAALSISNSWTIGAWVKADAVPRHVGIVSKRNGVADIPAYDYSLTIQNDGTPALLHRISGVEKYVLGTKVIDDSTWHYLAGVNDGTDLRIYVDGVLNGTGAGNGGLTDNLGQEVLIGFWRTFYNEIFKGSIDEVKIYNFALTEDEIKLDYNHGSAMVLGESVENRDRVTSGQTLYLDATDKTSYPGTGTAWYDRSGNGYNATLSSPTWNGLKFTNTAATLTGLGTSIYPNIATNTTILWVYPETGGGGVWSVTDQDGHTYMSYSGDGSAYINTWETGTYNQRTVWNVTESVPHQIVITKNGSVRTVYDNLVQKGQVTITNIATSVNSNIVYGSAAQPMGLSIVETYNRVLSMDEITQDYYAHAYKFNINAEPVAEWKMDEKTGANAYDTSGNGYVGTWYGTGSHWGLGKYGASGNFNGSDDYVLSSNYNESANQEFTASVWFYPTVNQSSNGLFSHKSNGVSGWFIAAAYGTSNTPAFYTSTGGTLNADTTFTLNSWNHLEVTFQSGTKKIYLNGRLAGTQTSASFGANNIPFTIGRYHSDEAAGYFTGRIDQIRYYNYARTPAQIAYDYNRGAPVGHWKMDECQGGTANDASGNSNNGTITIGATGTNTSAGTCTGSAGEAWKDGATGKYNSSLEFDGTDDYIGLPVFSSPTSLNDWTVSAWIYLNAQNPGTGNRSYVIDLRGNGATSPDSIGLFIDGTTEINVFQHYTSPSYSEYAGTVSSTLVGRWVHFVGQREGTTIKAFINGFPITLSLVGGIATTAQAMDLTNGGRIGTYSAATSGDYFFNGQIDDVKIFNYALTGNQVKTLYNQGSAIQFAPATGSP